MSVYKLYKESNEITLRVLNWAGWSDVMSMHGHNSRISHQITRWFLGDYGINQEGEPFYSFDIFQSYFHRDSVVELS